jgi:prepilin-type N-terminal cleavage/methylation domain-containing protein
MKRGVTLIELLITVVIGSITLCALAMPFIADRSFWASGRGQSEAQRDAQMVMRAIARVARESTGYTAATGFQPPVGPSRQFCLQAGQLFLADTCTNPTTSVLLIDGNRSLVTNLVIAPITNKLVRIQLEVTHLNRGTEQLETELLLRNAT